MGYLTERVSYLRGLVDGIKLDENSPESRIFAEIIELLDDMATSIEDVDEKQSDMLEEFSDLQDDVINHIYGEDDLDEDYDDDRDEDEDDGEFDPEEFVCPNCGEILPVDEDLLESEEEITLDCPGCGEKVTITLEDDEPDCEEYPGCGGKCDDCPKSEELPF